ncbi:MAG: sigma-70 family RNA polymerase sigma factor [Marinifilaceae bacterium]|jgi:RNA polymerase sigma factor (sigma-70 family)|nr:sigma-70 family RNA polymerase sigma factor [Marinifilaceae bacterium]
MDYNTDAILEGIKKNDNIILLYCYKEFFPSIKAYVCKNSGEEEDAKDLFQEAIIVVYRKLKSDSLNLNCNFKTYLYSICRLLWLKKLRDESRKPKLELIGEDKKLEGIAEIAEQNERYRLFQKHFLKISPDCQKLLRLFIDGFDTSSIVKKLGYSSKEYLKKRKFLCKKALIEGIKSDNEFNDIYDG